MDKANGGRVGGPTAGRDRVSCERCQSGSARSTAGDQPRVKSNGCRESKARKSGSHLTPRWSKRDSNLRSPEGVGGRSRQVRSPLIHVRSGCAVTIYLESFLFNYQFADEINC